MNFLILDVGTSSMRGILFREDGTMLHPVQKEPCSIPCRRNIK